MANAADATSVDDICCSVCSKLTKQEAILPGYQQWTTTDANTPGNSLARLSTVAFNFARALHELGSIEKGDFVQLFRRHNLGIYCYKKQRGPQLWCIICDGEEVIGHELKEANSDTTKSQWTDWVLKDRFKTTESVNKKDGNTKTPKFVYQFAWSVFPRANSRQYKFKQDEHRAHYIHNFMLMAKITFTSMFKGARKAECDSDKPVCCIFNPVGGGAFLRGVTPANLQDELLDMILIMLVYTFLTVSTTFRSGHDFEKQCPKHPRSHLILVGFGNFASGGKVKLHVHHSVLVANWMKQGFDANFITTFLKDDSFQIPGCVAGLNVDMIQVAKFVKSQNPNWKICISMAADNNALGNGYLGFDFFRGESLKTTDPFVGARRASDENNTRRTTLMEVAMAFNSLHTDYGWGKFSELLKTLFPNEEYGIITRTIQEKLSTELTDRQQVYDRFGCDASCPCDGVTHLLEKFIEDVKNYQRHVTSATVSTVIKHPILKEFIEMLQDL
eukprot:m.13459 g.13459  ORF g.13459 m.13459 type:complete len:502 (+) comp4859_c0_seq1:434-1939(+)